MENNQEKDRVFDSRNLIIYFYKWRLPLISITLIAAVLAVIFSSPFFIPPKYKSEVTVFPTTTNSPSKALLPQQSGGNQDILEFGAEEEADQLLQILHSDEIRRSIIEKYNLIEHYDIDTSGPYVRTEIFDAFDDNISFERTEFMSIEITVLDTDPDTAAMIANDIVILLDEVKNRIQKERAMQGLKIIEAEYNALKYVINSMEDSLTKLRYKGVHDYETQSSALNEEMASVVVLEGYDSWQYRGIKSELDTLAKYGGAYVAMRDELAYMRSDLIKIKTRMDQARVDVEQALPATFVVNPAYPAERKSYPIRWLIVAISALGAFTFTLMGIIVYDTVKKQRESEN